MKVKEIMSTEFETIDKDQILSTALDLMKKTKNVNRLIVTEDDKPVGIISYRDIADRLGTHKTDGISPKSLRVSSSMSYPLLTVNSEDDLEKAAKLMIDKHISSIVIMDGDELKGILTKFHLLKGYRDCKKITVEKLMTPNPIKISMNERVLSARNRMLQQKISALPVIGEEGEIIGFVDDETLAEALARFRDSTPIKYQKKRLKEFYVGQVMKTDPPSITKSAPLCDLIKLFEDSRFKGVLVLDEEERVAGIISVTDIAETLAKDTIKS